ncbi:ARF guanine-nucleotide exchange factor GNOM isoform X1 [Vigna radiata var. radiata]|uniref:ARF guanine-nucleotide exchange factor GNOM isoform X1 n=1 Tax=Vigna radiata var. radiata TaxID=3916 RepID=A0A1S3TQQ4_VIGRR|nr:ARF guanine-nucleotide exchange factor GNOM isoform X1 [Vigna radiata var. radiata]XP_022635125.1 ARF guanine-nucleotide exchange factor GNOM isoform X1 [Vigna radiata var. radiata]XP_022635126.1 ARF guanine-nucleotide exchange factor GNOM isoform X1 [Vigna radiata var. radiata]XP_022635127.1 ARF guanine-nucleotide exchange factor GNOM isoform X1 [Vigna radiata var. radiata]
MQMQTGFNAVEDQYELCEAGYPNKTAIACMINAEISAVLAVMRRNVRWGIHYISDDDQSEHYLVQSLKTLRRQIFSWKNQWRAINPALYLQPFLDVIRSDETSAPITGVALSSVYKILTLDVIDKHTVNVGDTMHLVVDSVTSCRFEVTDPGSEEVVLMKILQVLLACVKGKASVMLSNQHVCTIVNTCFRIVHQAGTKGELFQRIARYTMHELVRSIFSHLQNIDNTKCGFINGSATLKQVTNGLNNDHALASRKLENDRLNSARDAQPLSTITASGAAPVVAANAVDENTAIASSGNETDPHESLLMTHGVPCIVEIFHFLCSLLNVTEHMGVNPRSNTMSFDEDVPLFSLTLINSAIELGGPSFCHHPRLLCLIQDELFFNLMQFGLSMSPLVLSMVCSIVLNLYQHLRQELKLQLEAFFSCVILRLAQSKHGASYQQQEVVMEALVDFCRQKTFMVEMYANFDCDISCSDIFEDIIDLLSKSAFPVNNPLSSMHILSLDGLIAVMQGISERIGSESLGSEQSPVNFEEYTPFWMEKCDSFDDPNDWVPFVCQRKYIKRKLMIGADHFNRDIKKGLEFLQGAHLLPDKPDSQSVAYFLRYTAGLDKNSIGDFLGDHDEFYIQVLHEFAKTFDFHDMTLDTALRVFLETFRLPGESQKIHRVLEAFSERYYEQSPDILANKDAALVLSYSIILLNTDHHNVQVKKKMTEEDFIRNNRHINGGNDLPREFLSEIYHSICKSEIRTTLEPGSGFPEMTPSRWISLMHEANKTSPYIVSDSRAYLDYDMFVLLSGPTIVAISVAFDNAENKEVYQRCMDGFLVAAKISAHYRLENVLDDLVVCICKFITILDPLSVEDSVLALGDDTKVRIATETVFTIANRYGDYIRTGWRSILDCILIFYKLGLLPPRLASDAADESQVTTEIGHGKSNSYSIVSSNLQYIAPKRSSGLISRFSQLLSLGSEEIQSIPTKEQMVAHQQATQAIQKCHIDSIFTESKFLQAESLLNLERALINAGAQHRKGNRILEDEESSVFCLELLVAIILNNRDRVVLLWKGVYEHISNIIQSTVIPCALVEKAIFGLLRICHRLLPYKENITDELLRSLQLVLKLDALVADAYYEQITREVGCLVKANASHIRSQSGWRTITALLSITSRHLESSEAGFDALLFIMSDGAHLLPANYILCVDAARQFAESRVGQVDRSIIALDLMASSVNSLEKWSNNAKKTVKQQEVEKMLQDIGEMWFRLVQGLGKVSLDQREEVRNHALLCLQKCLKGTVGTHLPRDLWLTCFDQVIFTVLEDLLEIAQSHSQKVYPNIEGTLVIALKLVFEVFLQLLLELSQSASFCKLWEGVLSCMEKCMKMKIKGRRSENLQDLVPELLKYTLLVMKSGDILVQINNGSGENSLWELTWLHMKNIAPSLQSEVFPEQDPEQLQHRQVKAVESLGSDANISDPSNEKESNDGVEIS